MPRGKRHGAYRGGCGGGARSLFPPICHRGLGNEQEKGPSPIYRSHGKADLILVGLLVHPDVERASE